MMVCLLLFLILQNRYTLTWFNKSPIDRCAISFRSSPFGGQSTINIFVQTSSYKQMNIS